MKIISDISLVNFKFWSGGQDTADELTNEQLERVEAELEALYPEGMTDTELNDMFWFDRDTVFEWAGCYPKYFKITSSCGRVKYIKAEDADEIREIEDNGIEFEEIEEDECGDIEDLTDVDLDEFDDTRYFAIWSRHAKRKLILHCQGDSAAEDLKDSFSMCEVEEIVKVPADGIDDEDDWEDYEHDFGMIDGFAYDEDDMYNCYDIPVYAIPRICKLILDQNGALDYYDIPESHAINEYNRYLELSDEDIKNIDGFVADLHKAMPDGFTIDWDVESVSSPSFEHYPAFGLAMDCVKLRVYPKN